MEIIIATVTTLTNIMGLLRGLNEVIDIKLLEQCLAHVSAQKCELKSFSLCR